MKSAVELNSLLKFFVIAPGLKTVDIPPSLKAVVIPPGLKTANYCRRNA